MGPLFGVGGLSLAEASRGCSFVAEHRFSCPAGCEILLLQIRGWNMSPAVAGRFLTTGHKEVPVNIILGSPISLGIIS